jgi:hypothetical protein
MECRCSRPNTPLRRTFYLQMVDHLFSDPALQRLSLSPLASREAGRVLVDSEPSLHIDIGDATKYSWPESASRPSARAGHLGRDRRRLLPADPCRVRRPPRRPAEGCTVSAGMRRLVAQGRLGAVDLHGLNGSTSTRQPIAKWPSAS